MDLRLVGSYLNFKLFKMIFKKIIFKNLKFS